jgi:hypothetical protein
MCNLYSLTTNQEAMHRLARTLRDSLATNRRCPRSSPTNLRLWCAWTGTVAAGAAIAALYGTDTTRRFRRSCAPLVFSPAIGVRDERATC